MKPKNKGMKTLGDILLEKLTQHQLFRVSHPDPDEPHVFTWQANSAEQLEGMFREAQKEYWAERREERLRAETELSEVSSTGLLSVCSKWGHRVKMTIDHQTFDVGPVCRTRKDALWWQDQLEAALQRLLDNGGDE